MRDHHFRFHRSVDIVVLILLALCLGWCPSAAFQQRSSLSSLRPLSLRHLPVSTKLTSQSDSSVSALFLENDSERLKRARLKLAEAQGIVPSGVSGLPLDVIRDVKPNTIATKARELSRRVAEPEIRYDPKAIATKLFAQPWRWIQRNLRIFVPISFFVIKIISDIVLRREERMRAKRAQQLLTIISTLSPAFVKAGQALSSRADLLPKEYLQALQTLQDRCPPFSNTIAFQSFQEETGHSFEEVFELESVEPIAAASIGQVYKGRLRATNQTVAIKVQRPHCQESIELDVFVMRGYAKRIQQLLALFGRKVDLVSVVDDFGDLLYREIDYRAEVANAQRFAELYGNLPDIYVPQVYPQLSTRRVLTMEWVDGVRLTDMPALARLGLQPTKLVNALVQCSLRQMLENGFFHADPHAGNLLAMPSGQLCYLDFGMVSYVEATQRSSIIESVVHMVNRDFVALTESYRKMGFIPVDVDTQPIIQALEQALPDVLNASVEDFNLKNVISKLGDVMYKFPFSLPPFYIAIIRCFGVLEGLALTVDREFRILSDAYPYIASRLLMDASPELQTALQRLLFTEAGRLRWDRLEDLLAQAMSIPDYNVAQAVEQGIKYLVSAPATSLRLQLAEELVNGFDELESDALELILSYASSGELSWTSLRHMLNFNRRDTGSSSSSSTASSQRAIRSLDTLLDRFLALQSSSPGRGHSALYSLARALRTLRSAGSRPPTTAPQNGTMTAQSALAPGSLSVTMLFRKLTREPVLQEWLIQIVGDISERISMKMVKRMFGRESRLISDKEKRRRLQRHERRLRRAAATTGGGGWGRGRGPAFGLLTPQQAELGTTAINMMAMAFFSGLDALLQPGAAKKKQQQQQQQQLENQQLEKQQQQQQQRPQKR